MTRPRNARSILILSSNTFESTGGFVWTDNTRAHFDGLLEQAYRDSKDFGNVVLLELRVNANLVPSEITDLIDYELLDLIEERKIGKLYFTSRNALA